MEPTNQLSISQDEQPIVENNKQQHDNENDEHTVGADGEESEGSTATHPLEYEWTFWYDKRPAAGKRMKGEQESYESNLRAIGTFGTVSYILFAYHVFVVRSGRVCVWRELGIKEDEGRARSYD